ncbi:MAG TPA: acyclic terpene utilization AtuA family protein [Chloroflexia bacterium]|nr:acyclic terpene utilization AtuA family protein [Chloroflexia bacterium]
MKTVKIGGGQAFYGDSSAPAIEMAQRAEGLNYIAFDCLSELTLAILQKDKRRDPARGFALDMLALMLRILPVAQAKGIRLVTNGGGMNPLAARDAVSTIARKLGLKGLKIAVVTGDDILERLDELIAKGYPLANLDSGEKLAESQVRQRVVNANAYLGADVVCRALETGADVVITGRVTDSALFLGPLLHEFGWASDNWNLLAKGIVCGHLLECAGQVVGGNYAGGWRDVENLEEIGYPIAEVNEDGSFVVTKTPGSGGLVSFDTVREQLLYEVLDPHHYLTPDVDANFTTVCLEDTGRDRVLVTGATGGPRPDSLKVCIGYEDGWLGEAQVLYSWPDALEKAERANALLRKRLEKIGFKALELRTDYIGYNGLHGPLAPRPVEPNEIVLRVAAHTAEQAEAEKLFRELVPLGLNGPPTASGVGSRPRPRELLTLWPALMPRQEVEPFVRIELLEV